MPVPTAITDLSTTAASNSPAGSDSPTDGDNHIRALAAFIRQLYDGSLTLSNKTLASPVGTGQFSNALGSASAPSYSFTGDLNTGVYSSGADTLDFVTGGTRRVSINSSGAMTDQNSREYGYRDIPVSGNSGAGDITSASRGMVISQTDAATLTVVTGLSEGNAVSIYNNNASSMTIAQGAGMTLRLAGTTSTGNRTLAARGIATVLYLGSTEAVISGAGVS